MGILSMDDGAGASAARRSQHRTSWFRYRSVWTYEKRNHRIEGGDGSGSSPTVLDLLPKFVVARPFNRSLSFSRHLTSETQHYRDVVALDMWEGDPSGGKRDSGDVGLWSLGADLGMSLKSLLWRLHALGAYRTSFIGKMDDDAFLYVPNYLATLRSIPHGHLDPKSETHTQQQPIYWGYLALCRRDVKRPDTDFLYAYGMLNTVSTSVVKAILSRSPDFPRAMEILNRSSTNFVVSQQTAVEAVRQSLDREDFMFGSLIDSVSSWNDPPSSHTAQPRTFKSSSSTTDAQQQHRQHTRRLWLLHDCRYLDTPVLQHTNKTSRLPQSIYSGKPWVVAMHKMQPDMYTSAVGDMLHRWPDRDAEDHQAEARAWRWKLFRVTSSLEPGGSRNRRVHIVWYPAFAMHRCPQPIQGCVQGRRKLDSR